MDTEIRGEQAANSDFLYKMNGPNGVFVLMANQLGDDQLKNVVEIVVLDILKENLNNHLNKIRFY